MIVHSLLSILSIQAYLGLAFENTEEYVIQKQNLNETTTGLFHIVANIMFDNCCDYSSPSPSSSPTLFPSERETETTASPSSQVTSALSFIVSDSASPTYSEKKLLASDGVARDEFGNSCSMSEDVIVIGAPMEGDEYTGAAYVFNLDGSEVNKITPDSDAGNSENFGHAVSVDEKIVIGTSWNNYIRVTSLRGYYERTISCDDCSIFGSVLATHGETIVATGGIDSSYNLYNLFIYSTNGTMLEMIEEEGDEINAVDISDDVIVSTTAYKTFVYSISSDFATISEIEMGGWAVATYGDRIVIGNEVAYGGYNGAAFLYNINGTHIKDLESTSDFLFGTSVDITAEKIIIGTHPAASVSIYSTETGEFEETVSPAPDTGLGRCVGMSGSYFVSGAPDVDDNGYLSGAGYIFTFSN